MQNVVKIVIETQLDQDTIREIEVMRSLRLDHYRLVAKAPEKSLELLKRVGLTEETSPALLQAKAFSTIQELEARLLEPLVIYEEELSLYAETLNSSES